MTKFQGNAAITIIEHEGVSIVHQYDVRGPQHDDFYDLVTVELDGEECTFNTIDDARAWIDEQLDIPGESYDAANEEHRLGGRQLV